MWVTDLSAERDHLPVPVTRPASDFAPSAHPPRRLLLVEDSVADVQLFKHRMRACAPDTKISVAGDGASAMEVLDEIIEGTVPSPDLLVLDLNLPILKGWAVLRYMKRSPLLRFIPVVVLSSSRAQRDIERAYDEGAASFIHKGRDLDDFFGVVDAIHAYWCGVADLPQDPGKSH